MKSLADLVIQSALAVNPLILPFAILCGLVLAAVALSLAACFRAKSLVRGALRDAALAAKADLEHCESQVESLRTQLNGVAEQLQEARREAASSTTAFIPRPGMNLNKRSQALRMQRRGDPPSEIASALGVPLQEVDLLLKVHRIVMSSV